MASLKPWYKVVTPREDLREGRPMDASEFAVHLDQVRDGRAPTDYQKPERFFERTFLTRNLTDLSAEVTRRLSGIATETSAVFNMTTQFGGGKTHFLTLLYHLARNGPAADRWQGVSKILDRAGVRTVPGAATAVFVGTEFDSLTGRGGDDGTPLRKTPWGEIAFQLGGPAALAVLAEHEKQQTAPAGDVIRKFLPKDRPALILIDELMNYVSRNRKTGLGSQLYHFLQNLSEEARGQRNVVLAVSVPASELEMTAEDQGDYERFKKLLDRLGKPVIMSAEAETSEIIRRRLFEWGGLPDDGKKACADYADWVADNRNQVPSWFPIDHAREAFEATYPFHPMTLSVFERKWQALPRFQQTRGVLRLLALWVARAYQDGFKGAHRDALIGLGTAPLEDTLFRTAAFEQLGESRLEGAVTTDIVGKTESHAARLDKEAEDAVKKARLHRKAATVVFFESNGGQARAEATQPEIRLAVAEPGMDLGHVETVLEALSSSCYYLHTERNRYRFNVSPNLNKLLADRRANIPLEKIDERVRSVVQETFAKGSPGVDRVYFPEKSIQVPNRPALILTVLAPTLSMEDEKKTRQAAEAMTREYGSSDRTFKTGVVWCVADSPAALQDEARKLLAWEDIDAQDSDRLDDGQKRQLAEQVQKARRDLREAVWRTYKHVLLLGKDNTLQHKDLGLVHSSAAGDLTGFVLSRLQQDGEVEAGGVSPTFLIRHWPPAFKEWSTKAVRDAFFASPQFPRLLKPDTLRDTIAKGVVAGALAYVGKGRGGRYEPFHFEGELDPADVELSDEMFVIIAEEAKRHIEPPQLTGVALTPPHVAVEPGKRQAFQARGKDQHGNDIATGLMTWSATGGEIDVNGVFTAGADEGSYLVTASAGGVQGSATVVVVEKEGPGPVDPGPEKKEITRLSWQGDVPAQKWMNFYTKVLSKFAAGKGLRLTVKVEYAPEGPVPPQKIEEAKVALRELGLDDNLRPS